MRKPRITGEIAPGSERFKIGVGTEHFAELVKNTY